VKITEVFKSINKLTLVTHFNNVRKSSVYAAEFGSEAKAKKVMHVKSE